MAYTSWSLRLIILALLALFFASTFTACASYELQGSFNGEFELADKSKEEHTFIFYNDGRGEHTDHQTGITSSFYYTTNNDLLTLHNTDNPDAPQIVYTYSFNEDGDKLILKDKENNKSGSFDRK